MTRRPAPSASSKRADISSSFAPATHLDDASVLRVLPGGSVASDRYTRLFGAAAVAAGIGFALTPGYAYCGKPVRTPTAAVPHHRIRLPSPRPSPRSSPRSIPKARDRPRRANLRAAGLRRPQRRPTSVVANARPSASETAHRPSREGRRTEVSRRSRAGHRRREAGEARPSRPSAARTRRRATRPLPTPTVQAEATQEPAAAAASIRPRRSRTRSRPTPPPRRGTPR